MEKYLDNREKEEKGVDKRKLKKDKQKSLEELQKNLYTARNNVMFFKTQKEEMKN